MELCNPAVVRQVLEKYGTLPKKGFGQNFLINPSIPERIAESSAEGAAPGTCALEIGPGVGALTQALSACYDRVAALEIDRHLLPLLEETLADCPNVKVIGGDVMETDVPLLIQEQFGDAPVHVCANLPYYITTPVLMKLLDSLPVSKKPRISSVTVMVQSEVAARICAEPGTPDYGALTVAVGFRGTARRLFTVSAGNFYPVPKVSSSVVRIDLFSEGTAANFKELCDAGDRAEELFGFAKELVAKAFGQRRKTLVNTMGPFGDKAFLSGVLEALGFRADVRGERLSAADFIRLAARLRTV